MTDFIKKSILLTSSAILLFVTFATAAQAQNKSDPPPVEDVKIDNEKVKDIVPEKEIEPEKKEEVPPITIVADPGFGDNKLVSRDYFRAESNLAQVDKRGEIDAMADHAILLPTAFTPKQFSTSFTTTNLLLNTFSFSPTDNLQLSASAVIPTQITDFMLNGSVKFRLKTDPNYIISAQPFFSYQAGQEQLDVANFGAGGGLLADFYITDRLVISTGSFVFLNMVNIVDQLNYDACQTHSDFVDGNCINTDSQVSFPSGGHWMSLQASLLYYIYDSFSLRLEAISGLTLGSFLGTEYFDGRDGFTTKTNYFEDPSVGIGVPRNSIITLGAGIGWARKNFGFKASAYLWRGEIEQSNQIIFGGTEPSARSQSWVLTPSVSLTVKF